MKIFRCDNTAVVQGAVDRVSVEGVRGWCATSQTVCISVNGREYFHAFCQNERRDVQAALGVEACVGFSAPLNLLPSDVVEVATSCHKPLPGSPQRVEAGAWLSVEDDCPASFAPLKSLFREAGASHFKPFFQRNAELAAVGLRGNARPDMLVKLNVTPAHIQDVQAFYRHVITPYSLPAPALITVPESLLSVGDRLIYHYIEGKTYSSAVPMTNDARRQVIDILGRLHDVPSDKLQRLNKQQPYWVYLQRQVIRQAIVSRDMAYIKQIIAMWRSIRCLPKVLSHGDLHAGNILINEKTGYLALIDWDRWGALPVGYDEACFLRGMPFEQSLDYLPKQHQLRLGFTVASYWLGAAQGSTFRHTLQAKQMAKYFRSEF